MQIFRGTSRLVLLLGPVALKVPRGFITGWPRVVAALKELFWRRRLLGLKINLRIARTYLVEGIQANRSEARCWQELKASYLAPTYFSFFGLINIQKRMVGVWGDCDEYIKEVIPAIWAATNGELRKVNPHEHSPENVRLSKQGWVFVDYGSTSARPERRIDNLFRKYNKEIAHILSRNKSA